MHRDSLNWTRQKKTKGRWHNGSAFVFCPGDCLFKSDPSPTSAHACGEVTGCALAARRSVCVAPEVDLGECTLRNKAEPTLALKPRGDVTRNPKKGYQWPQKRTCVRPKTFLKKENKYYVITIVTPGRYVITPKKMWCHSVIYRKLELYSIFQKYSGNFKF